MEMLVNPGAGVNRATASETFLFDQHHHPHQTVGGGDQKLLMATIIFLLHLCPSSTNV